MNKQKKKEKNLSGALKANLLRRKAERKITELPSKEPTSKDINNSNNESNNY